MDLHEETKKSEERLRLLRELSEMKSERSVFFDEAERMRKEGKKTKYGIRKMELMTYYQCGPKPTITHIEGANYPVELFEMFTKMYDQEIEKVMNKLAATTPT